MFIVRKMNQVDFLDLTRIAAARWNYFIEFCKTIDPDLIQDKPIDRLAAWLNHPAELYW